MSAEPTIFIFFSCNEWKEYGSMQLIAASTDISDIHKAIRAEIREGNMNYKDLTKRTGSKLFGEDFQNNKVDLNLLDYGYVMEEDNLSYKKRPRRGKIEKTA